VGNDDTAETAVRILKAYLVNDIHLLEKIRSRQQEALWREKEWALLDSCVHQPRLQDMGIEEGYRFMFSEAFCNDRLNITVTKLNDSINLHYIIYTCLFSYDSMKFNCKVKNEYDRRLTKDQWEDLIKALHQADFWALAPTNDVSGVDGNAITIIGFRNSRWQWDAPRTHKIHRWLVNSTYVGNAFYLALKLSDGHQGCIWIE
jgi:hypothetical protein